MRFGFGDEGTGDDFAWKGVPEEDFLTGIEGGKGLAPWNKLLDNYSSGDIIFGDFGGFWAFLGDFGHKLFVW